MGACLVVCCSPSTGVFRHAGRQYFFEEPEIDEEVRCSTASGVVVGFRKHHALTFRGIPFGMAVRNQPPRTIEPWRGERNCLRFGPACPQPGFGQLRIYTEGLKGIILESVFGSALPEEKSFSMGEFSEEHCLNLNVHTPALDGTPRPVLAWLPGGQFMAGSNSEMGLYDGTELCKRGDVVVVSINYRTGPFGFQHFPDQRITNLGLRDQIAALQWIQQNVASFGGDPGNVTLCGQSAGAMSVGCLLVAPAAKGLFHKAILMSGGCHATHPPDDGQQGRQAEIEVLGKKWLPDGKLTADAWAKLSSADIVKLMQKTQVANPMKEKHGTFGMLWQPIRDGDLVPLVGGPLAAGSSITVPVLVGHLSDEWQSFRNILSSIGGVSDRSKVPEFLTPLLRASLGLTSKTEPPGAAGKWPEYCLEFYDAVKTAREDRGQPAGPVETSEACGNTAYFEDPAFCLARSCQHAYCYRIVFDDEPWRGGHSRDLALLFAGGDGGFSAYRKSTNPQYYGAAGEGVYDSLTEQVIEAWTSFARTGRPETAPLGPWPGFSHAVDVRCPKPEARMAETPELVAFARLKQRVVKELGLDLAHFPSLRLEEAW